MTCHQNVVSVFSCLESHIQATGLVFDTSNWFSHDQKPAQLSEYYFQDNDALNDKDTLADGFLLS